MFILLINSSYEILMIIILMKNFLNWTLILIIFSFE
jgi:hypothetical protein